MIRVQIHVSLVLIKIALNVDLIIQYAKGVLIKKGYQQQTNANLAQYLAVPVAPKVQVFVLNVMIASALIH